MDERGISMREKRKILKIKQPRFGKWLVHRLFHGKYYLLYGGEKNQAKDDKIRII